MTRRYRFVTVDVFTDTRFGGNPLAVFPDAEGLADAEMQALAAEFNLSETTFVLPPSDPAHTARVRIFNRTAEMPFAGHPNVGTGWVLAQEGRDSGGLLLFEEIAGLVEVRVLREGGAVTGARISAPQPLSTGAEVAPELVAACVGLPPSALLTGAHRPIVASVGNSFVIAEVAPDALPRAVPDLAAFRRAAPGVPELGPGRLPIYLYARDGARLRARMFSPLSGTVEDAATGSAATPLAALLLRLSGQECAEWDIVQGVEMGRPSLLRTSAWQTDRGIRAAVAGGCVHVLKGEAEL
ncbi:MAG TPA: PhzF family phenazine biosynthesis protein [Acetobacteraceae bacterium]|nr:PhzF family phenazine biosynthesis protein [Acetobacteraceae bacterium]